jgi:hypothetical protein
VYNLFGIMAIFAGALTWWFALVSFINLFRKKINVRSLKFVNRVTGSVIIALAIAGFVFSVRGGAIG